MSADTWQFLGILVTAIGTVTGLFLSTRQSSQKTRTDAATGLIDQIQEEMTRVEARCNAELERAGRAHASEIARLEARLVDMASVMGRLEDRERALEDYSQSLRHHIDKQMGPPPPPWPSALLRFRHHNG